MDTHRRIIHLDFDTLYVSLERAINPRLRGRPVVVGGRAERRGIITSASREAHAAGIAPSMPVAHARTLCPDLVVIPGGDELYDDSVRTVLRYLQRFAPVWERASPDRIFLDLTGTHALFGTAIDTSVRLCRELKNRFSLDSTIGVATNKLVSRIASDTVVSGGLCDVSPGSETKFLAPLPVKRLPGVGIKTMKRLGDFNIHTIHDLTVTGKDLLVAAFGRYGTILYANSLGLDDSPVGDQYRRTAIITSETLSHDTNDPEFLRHTLRRIVEEGAFHLRCDRLCTKRIRVAITYVDRIQKHLTEFLPLPTDLDNEISPVTQNLLHRLLERRLAVRRITVRFSGLSPVVPQLSLINDNRQYDRKRSLLSASDRIRRTFGNNALRRGIDLMHHQTLIS
jgi:DNA polymerase-4